jgi:hypothetical protein
MSFIKGALAVSVMEIAACLSYNKARLGVEGWGDMQKPDGCLLIWQGLGERSTIKNI